MFLHSNFLPVDEDALIVDQLPVSHVLAIGVDAAAGFCVLELLLYCGHSGLAQLAFEAAIEKFRLHFGGAGDSAVNTHHFSKTASFQLADLVDSGQVVDC